jgi:long-chain acyl-CoA synthetase
MDRIWLKSYPAGVPAEVDLNEFQSIGDLFDKGAAAYAACRAILPPTFSPT